MREGTQVSDQKAGLPPKPRAYETVEPKTVDALLRAAERKAERLHDLSVPDVRLSNAAIADICKTLAFLRYMIDSLGNQSKVWFNSRTERWEPYE